MQLVGEKTEIYEDKADDYLVKSKKDKGKDTHSLVLYTPLLGRGRGRLCKFRLPLLRRSRERLRKLALPSLGEGSGVGIY